MADAPPGDRAERIARALLADLRRRGFDVYAQPADAVTEIETAWSALARAELESKSSAEEPQGQPAPQARNSPF